MLRFGAVLSWSVQVFWRSGSRYATTTLERSAGDAWRFAFSKSRVGERAAGRLTCPVKSPERVDARIGGGTGQGSPRRAEQGVVDAVGVEKSA